MPALKQQEFPATPGQFVKDNMTDLVNLFLGWAVFWCYGFRVVLWCGYTRTQAVSQFYCDQFLSSISETITGCAPEGDVWPSACEEWRNIPAYTEKYTVDLYEQCTGRNGLAFETRGSLSPLGQYCSGTNGSGEFLVTLFLMILTTVVFFWKMAKFVSCPDKLERKRRKEVMLKNFLLSQKSTTQQ